MLLEELIQNISEFLNSGESFEDLYKIIESYKENDWIKYVKINPNTFNRRLIYRNNIFDVYIITWNVGQKANVHDHSKHGCWLSILEGELEEIVYDSNLKKKKVNILREGDKGFMKNDLGYHSISNKREKIAVSLHVYSPSGHCTKYLNNKN